MFTLPNASEESLLLPHEVTTKAQNWVEFFNPLALLSKLVKFLRSVLCASRPFSGQSQQHIGGIWVTVEQIVQGKLLLRSYRRDKADTPKTTNTETQKHTEKQNTLSTSLRRLIEFCYR